MNPEPAENLNLSPVIEGNASIELSPEISEKEPSPIKPVAEKRKVSAATLLREEWDTDTAENSTRETITPPPAKKQKSEAKENRKNVTKLATRITKKTSPRINKSSLKSNGKRKSFNASVRFEPLVQMQSVPNEENENYGMFDTNRSMPKKSAVKKGKKSTKIQAKITKRNCNKEIYQNSGQNYQK